MVDEKLCNQKLHYDENNNIATTYTGIKYDNKGKLIDTNEIFKAKNQLIKFMDYDTLMFLKRLEYRGFDPKENYLIWFWHPIIIFDGLMYEAIIKDGLIDLVERDHIILYAKHTPRYVEYFPNTEDEVLYYLIDVVKKDYFPKFLEILEGDYKILWNCIYNNLSECIARVKEVMKYFKKTYL